MVGFRQTWLLIGALLVWSGGNPIAEAGERAHGCLYSFNVGSNHTPVAPCVDGDPQDLSHDNDIRKVMSALGIEQGRILFRGCKNVPFSASPEGAGAGASRRYVITYPSEGIKSYLAPITHELAHVLQMEVAGSLQALQSIYTSIQIELGADFLTGIVFSQVLKHASVREFQHSLSLVGLYIESDHTKHGTPAQRTVAFRRGVYLPFERFNGNFRVVNEYFFADIYGEIIW